jgi:hypothetical protein
MTEQRQPTLPTQSLLQGKRYTPWYATDIRATFARFQTEKPSCATTGMPS